MAGRDIAGPEMARRSRPGELRAGALTVLVDNSPWLQEVTTALDRDPRRHPARHGPPSRRCAARLEPCPPRDRRSRTTGLRPPIPLSAEEEHAVDTIIAPVTDPVLAASVRRLVTKDLIARRRHAAVPPARREHT